jgi:hypothetical protein
MRGFSRGHGTCTYGVVIGIVDLGISLKEDQSLEKDKSRYTIRGGLVAKTL